MKEYYEQTPADLLSRQYNGFMIQMQFEKCSTKSKDLQGKQRLEDYCYIEARKIYDILKERRIKNKTN